MSDLRYTVFKHVETLFTYIVMSSLSSEMGRARSITELRKETFQRAKHVVACFSAGGLMFSPTNSHMHAQIAHMRLPQPFNIIADPDICPPPFSLAP